MSYTPSTNLSLPLITTGTESGTWGDVVDNGLTSYLDIAIAGGLSISITTADVTLTNTAGTSSATNIGSTTAQYAILNITGAKTAARNLIVPSSSKYYLINNSAATGGFTLTVKGAATTGVALIDGEKAIIAWNGSDYVKIANTNGNATFNNLVANGSVGIGNSSPSYKLDVSGTLHATGLATFDNAVNFNTATLNYLYYNTAIAFAQNGTGERMHIDNNGNLGIGTSSPLTKLDVNGSILSEGDSSGYAFFAPKYGTGAFGTNYDRFEIRVDPSNPVAFIGNTNGGTGAARALVFQTASTEWLRIGTAGQIGLSGANYGTSGQVLTSQGSGSAPIWSAAGIGPGQSWTDVTSSRTFGTTYTNSTGKPIMAAVATASGQYTSLACTIGGVAVQNSAGSWPAGAAASQSTISIIIPNGATYTFVQSVSSGGSAPATWFELR